jgi:diguanylate cyclase (GGDEF)-like protein
MKRMEKWLFLVVGMFAIAAISYFSYYAKEYYVNSNKILYTLNKIKKEENKLNYDVLYTSMFLYSDNDIISETIKKIKKDINSLQNLKYYEKNFPKSYQELMDYKDKFDKKTDLIYEFLRFSMPLKNSMIYLGNGLKFLSFKNPNSTKAAIRIVSSIFLAKNTVDLDFLKNLKTELNKLKSVSHNQYDEAFYKNATVFLEYFPEYKNYLNEIITYPTGKYVDKSLKDFNYRVKSDLKIFDYLSLALILFISSLLFMLILLNKQLEDKLKYITYLLENDALTSLPNRFKFTKDIVKYKRPVVVVFNIDKFKNINDYFGNRIGDEVLKFVAKKLEEYVKANFKCANVYRIGADDFAFVFERRFTKKEIKNIALRIIDFIENQTFHADGLEFRISLSAGVALSEPFLEKADIALKKIKKDIREKVGFYDASMQKDILINIRKSNEIKEAINNKGIIPYFQPIVDKNLNVLKHEVLCRLKLKNGEVRSIYGYLNVLKENKMYYKITEIILKESLKKLREYPDLNLSINLMMEDIIDKDQYDFIMTHYTNPHIASRVTFEILEKEINDYEVVQKFILEMKKYGTKFAIDDFGSGYSNFNRVLQLKIDYLKIDGSLIKDINKDENARLIVETIMDFSRKINIRTIAEYVHSKAVFEEAKKIGISCFQGYYFAKPSKEIITKIEKM